MIYTVYGYVNGRVVYTVGIAGLDGVVSIMKKLNARGCTEFKVRLK